MDRRASRIVVTGVFLASVAVAPAVAQDLPEVFITAEEEPEILSEEELEAYAATTTDDPEIPLEELELLLLPLTLGELEIEASAWLKLVKAKLHELADAEIAARHKRQEIDQAEAAAAAAQEASEAVEEAEQSQAAGAAGAAQREEAEEAARQAAEEAQAAVEALEEIQQKTELREGAQEVVEEAESEAASAAGPGDELDLEAAAAKAAVADTETLEQVAEAFEDAAEAEAEVRDEIFDRLAEIREARTRLVDRARLVLDELDDKGGEVDDRRAYLAAVSGIVVDVTDAAAAKATLLAWVKSPEGGLRWLKNFAAFLAVILAALFAAQLVSRLVGRVLKAVHGLSELTRGFVVKSLRWLIVAMGFLAGLSMMEVNVGPVLAVIGAAGFVIAFALQDSLSNLASGIMIMIFRPFDLGDAVEVAGVRGTITAMNLVAATLKTPDNRVVVIPNNEVWGGVITNLTGSDLRRVDLTFTISREADVAKAQGILESLVEHHPLVLDDPPPVVEVEGMDDSGVTFTCRPWTKTPDRRKVRWDLTRSVKLKFDEAGI